VHHALSVIADVLAAYAAAAVDAGASGIFFAIVKLARQGVLSESEYARFGRPYDLRVLQAVQGAPFNLLHVCGPQVHFDSMLDYPVHAINWATLNQNNPTVGSAQCLTQRALIGGVDELSTLQTGTPDHVIAEAQVAIRATGGRRFLLAPGCGTRMDVPAANLHALRRAVELPL
jgi:uroporphyrinogen decarboxylase